MSTIHRSCVLVGRRSALSSGTARFSTVRSIEYRRHGSASTARPIHSRRPARVVLMPVPTSDRHRTHRSELRRRPHRAVAGAEPLEVLAHELTAAIGVTGGDGVGDLAVLAHDLLV